ncbi:MAG: PilX N-terminal domain-containing pilus assembly protein [bacterium]
MNDSLEDFGKSVHDEEGAVLITSLLLIFILTLMGMTAMISGSINVTIADNYKQSRAAFYAAEAGIERAVGRIIDTFEDLSVYSNSQEDPNANGQGTFIIPDLNNYQITYTINNPLNRFLYTTFIGTASTLHWAYPYRLDSEAVSLSNKSRARITEQIRILETPLVQYYIFYGGSGNEADLEWLPGPTMNSWGRVHSNGDVYLWSHNTLTFRNYTDSLEFTPHSLTACGSIFRRRKDSSASMSGQVKIRINNDHTIPGLVTDYKELPAAGITRDNWESIRGQFHDYLMIGVNAYTGVTTKSVERGGFYEHKAEDPKRDTVDGMKIVRDGGGAIRVFCSRPVYQEVTAWITAEQPLAITQSSLEKNDQREGKPVDFIVLDMNLLEEWYVNTYLAIRYSAGLAGEGILIYVSQTPATGFVAGPRLQAIKLAKSTVPRLLDETTLCTDNPLYIEGNFNTINKRGCCLISDAINILSNGWAAAQAASPGTFTVASATSINAAFISGNVPTPAGGGAYSGGLENYPRFHENWSGITCSINGCFINLWSSVQATGHWYYGSPVYEAPNRNWGWDTAFEDFNFWPPFVPSIYSVQRGAWKEL